MSEREESLACSAAFAAGNGAPDPIALCVRAKSISIANKMDYTTSG
jgi:hypothetical protein